MDHKDSKKGTIPERTSSIDQKVVDDLLEKAEAEAEFAHILGDSPPPPSHYRTSSIDQNVIDSLLNAAESKQERPAPSRSSVQSHTSNIDRGVLDELLAVHDAKASQPLAEIVKSTTIPKLSPKPLAPTPPKASPPSEPEMALEPHLEEVPPEQPHAPAPPPPEETTQPAEPSPEEPHAPTPPPPEETTQPAELSLEVAKSPEHYASLLEQSEPDAEPPAPTPPAPVQNLSSSPQKAVKHADSLADEEPEPTGARTWGIHETVIVLLMAIFLGAIGTFLWFAKTF